MTELGRLLLALSLATPLAMVPLALLVRRPLRLLPWAAVPGLAAALLAPFGATAELPMLLLGLRVGLDRIGAVFLGFGALLWGLAAVYATGYLADTRRAASFAVFWLLTLAGALGTFVAADIVTFYAAFSMMSLATYGLVVHDRTAAALRAGRVYIVMAVLGETALVAAFMLAASHADSLLLSDVRAAVAASPWRDYVFAGLLVGFGIKAGLVPLHVWLPLAHPQAPTPASAVLSGVIVKAGIIGLIRLLPPGELPLGWAETLVVLGLVTAYFGVAAGLLQADAKAILAYSTLSQMGIVAAVLASGAGDAGSAARTFDIAALYATHHGLAKGALFLAVGVVAASGERARFSVLAVTAFTALAIAGLPPSGGAAAKLALKEAPVGAAGLLVSLSAVGTALLMLRFLWVLSETSGDAGGQPPWRLVVPWCGAAAAAVAVPWLLFRGMTGQAAWHALSPANLWTALWPILLALIAAAVVARRRWRVPFVLPQGDLAIVGEAVARRIAAGFARQGPVREGAATPHDLPFAGALGRLQTAEQALRSWSVSGPTIVVVAALIGLALAM